MLRIVLGHSDKFKCVYVVKIGIENNYRNNNNDVQLPVTIYVYVFPWKEVWHNSHVIS